MKTTRRAYLSAVAAASLSGCQFVRGDEQERDPIVTPFDSSCTRSRTWPCFQGSPDHSGITGIGYGGAPDERFLLERDFSNAGAFLVGTSEELVVATDAAGALGVVDIASGQYETEALEGVSDACPAIADGTVYHNTSMTLYALNLCRLDAAKTDRPEYLDGNLNATDDRIVVPGSYNVASFAVDGTDYWVHPISHPTGTAIRDGSVYLTNRNRGDPLVEAVDLTTGQVEWQSEETGRVLAEPAVSEHLYVVDADGTLYALDPDDGSVVWTGFAATNRSPRATPVIGDQRVYVGTGTSFYLDAFDTATGEKVMEHEYAGSRPGEVRPHLMQPPVLTEQGVLAPTTRGIELVSRADGTTLWQTDTCVNSPFVAVEDTIYAVTDDGILALEGERASDPPTPTP